MATDGVKKTRGPAKKSSSSKKPWHAGSSLTTPLDRIKYVQNCTDWMMDTIKDGKKKVAEISWGDSDIDPSPTLWNQRPKSEIGGVNTSSASNNNIREFDEKSGDIILKDSAKRNPVVHDHVWYECQFCHQPVHSMDLPSLKTMDFAFHVFVIACPACNENISKA